MVSAKIIVTGAGALLGQGIIRSLRASSLEVELIAVDPSPLAAGLCWADRAYRVPMAAAPDYLAEIEALLRLERPDALLLGTDVELALFAQERERLERGHGVHILVSSPAVVSIADDKWLTCQFLRQHGFPHPRSCLPGHEANLVREVGFPLVVKPRRGARSYGVSVVHDSAELARAVEGRPDVIIQECVGSDDTEYTAGVLCFDGTCAASIVMRRDLRDGNTYRAYIDSHPHLNDYVRRVAEALQCHGPANFQFRLDREEPKIFEINARFSGTTPFRAKAGFNEVEMCLRHLLFGEVPRQPPVKPMTIIRYLEEMVIDIELFTPREAEKCKRQYG